MPLLHPPLIGAFKHHALGNPSRERRAGIPRRASGSPNITPGRRGISLIRMEGRIATYRRSPLKKDKQQAYLAAPASHCTHACSKDTPIHSAPIFPHACGDCSVSQRGGPRLHGVVGGKRNRRSAASGAAGDLNDHRSCLCAARKTQSHRRTFSAVWA